MAVAMVVISIILSFNLPGSWYLGNLQKKRKVSAGDVNGFVSVGLKESPGKVLLQMVVQSTGI